MCGVYGNSLFLHHWCVNVCVVCLLLELLFKYTNMLSYWETKSLNVAFPFGYCTTFSFAFIEKPFEEWLYSVHFLSSHFHRNSQTPAVISTPPGKLLLSRLPIVTPQFILCDWAAALITPFFLEILHSLPWYHSLLTFHLVLCQVLSPISQVPLHIIDLFFPECLATIYLCDLILQ